MVALNEQSQNRHRARALGVHAAPPPRSPVSEFCPYDHSGSTEIRMVKKLFDSQGGNRGRRSVSMINDFKLAGNQWAASGRDPIPLSDAFAVMLSVSSVISVATPTVHKSAQSGQPVDRPVPPVPIVFATDRMDVAESVTGPSRGGYLPP